MKVLVIKRNGPLVVVETTGGIKGSGATVQSALSKIVPAASAKNFHGRDFDAVARLFELIKDDGQGSQIHRGVQS